MIAGERAPHRMPSCIRCAFFKFERGGTCRAGEKHGRPIVMPAAPLRCGAFKPHKKL